MIISTQSELCLWFVYTTLHTTHLITLSTITLFPPYYLSKILTPLTHPVSCDNCHMSRVKCHVFYSTPKESRDLYWVTVPLYSLVNRGALVSTLTRVLAQKSVYKLDRFELGDQDRMWRLWSVENFPDNLNLNDYLMI